MTMNTNLLVLIFLCFSISGFAQLGFGDAKLINDDWKFSLSDQEAYKESSFEDEQWEQVQLPHDWSVRQQLSPSLASCTGYLPGGIAWYRKSLVVPEKSTKEKVYLYFEGVYNRSEV